jgi:hypothetical protein
VVSSVREDHVEFPRPDRLRSTHPWFGEIMTRHRSAVLQGSPSYRDPVSGFSVFTASFLASRGYCCSSGCRHCPYEA